MNKRDICRREFIEKCGTGLAGIIAAGQAPAALVKSLIGAKETGTSKSDNDWENPYVTDGLIAMWDGEWNAGWGVHDPNATVWKDLVGSLDLTLASGGSFGTTHLQCDGTTVAAYATVNAGDISHMTAQYLISDIVASNGTRNLVCLPGSGGINSPVAALQTMSSGNMAITHTLRFPAPNANKVLLVTVEGDNTKSNYYGYPPNVYLNEGSRVSTSTSININNNGIWVCVGARRNDDNRNYGYPAQGKVHRIAIYSKFLTVEEIAYNYKIDKARFGL